MQSLDPAAWDHVRKYQECSAQTSIRIGTVMHKSELQLTIWPESSMSFGVLAFHPGFPDIMRQIIERSFAG